MDREKIRRRVKKCAAKRNCAFFNFDFAEYSYDLIPLKTSEKLLLAAWDKDFLIDGFVIARNKRITSVRRASEKYNEILRAEKVTDNIVVPNVNIENMRTVCEHFYKRGTTVSLDLRCGRFVIGRISGLSEKRFVFHSFDARGRWQPPMKIRYSDVMMVYFGDRYAETFARYVPEPEVRK